MFRAMVSWGIRPLARLCMGFLGRRPRLPGAWWRDWMLLAGPMRGPGGQVRGAVCAGQFTAERVKTRMAAAVMRMAQPARTSRLRVASVVVLVIPQMSCRAGAGVVEHAVAQQCQDVGGGQDAGDPGEPCGQCGDRE